jgi:hypothetical protein
VDIHLSLSTSANAWGDYGVCLEAFGRSGSTAGRCRACQPSPEATLGSPGSSAFWQGPGLCHREPPWRGLSHKALLVLLQLAVAQAGRLGSLRAWAWGPAAHSIISKPTRLVDARNVGGGYSSYVKAILIAYEPGGTIA